MNFKNLNPAQSKKLIRFLLIFLLIYLVGISQLGEKVAYHNGLGWDGMWYFDVCQNFLQKIFHHSYDSYRLQRILPFAIINIGLTILNAETSIANCIYFMHFLNLLMIIIGVFTYLKISDYLSLKLPTEIFGFAALFLNYPILKLNGYYPLLTDTFALNIALCQLYFFIRAKQLPVILIILGAFIWPTLLVTGLILKYLPASSIERKQLSSKERVFLKTIKIFIISAIPLGFFTISALTFHRHGNFKHLTTYYSGESYINVYMLLISLTCVMFYFSYMLKPINLPPTRIVKELFSLLKFQNILLFGSLFILIHGLINYLSNGRALVSMWEMICFRLILPPTVDPFVFVVSTFMYFGPCILFMLYYWRGVIEVVMKWGYSYFIISMLGVIMFVNTESRHFITYLPVFLFPLLVYMNTLRTLTIIQSFIILLLSLTLSRFWYHINVPGIEVAFDNKLLTSFPAQRYFMSHGPWMSHYMYFCFLGITLLVALFLAKYIFNSVNSRKEDMFHKNIHDPELKLC